MKYSEEEIELSYEKKTLSKILIGHLSMENKLDLIICTKVTNIKYYNSLHLRFPQKVDLGLAFELIPEKLGLFIKKFNSVRNKYAHRMTYEITFDEAFELAVEGNDSGLYYSDHGIWYDKEYSIKTYSVDDIIFETIYNINFCLMNEMENLGFEVSY